MHNSVVPNATFGNKNNSIQHTYLNQNTTKFSIKHNSCKAKNEKPTYNNL